jgi:hypothetical protein
MLRMFAAPGDGPDLVAAARVWNRLLIGYPECSDPIMRGYTAATDWMAPRFILQFDTSNEYNLERLEGMTAHEMQHLIRFCGRPFNPITTTVAD